jgi:hypothetical protein
VRLAERTSAERAMIVSHGFGCALIWWVNEQLGVAEEFTD